jgi:DNA-binding MarR family transcriptional regulator
VKKITLDAYVVEPLMADLVGHDKSTSSFLVYLYLWSRATGSRQKSTRASHQAIAEATGLSKSAVQAALRNLTRRRLVRSERESITATPEHFVLRPWIRK